MLSRGVTVCVTGTRRAPPELRVHSEYRLQRGGPADGKLYQTKVGASWQNVVNAGDLSGAIDGSQIASGSILGDALASGIIDASLLDPSIKTVQSVDGLPDLPDPQYPLGTVILETGEGKLYKAAEAADLVPIMTSNTAPSGVASASNEATGYEAWRTFDDTSGTYWLCSAPTGWLSYRFAVARVITRYRITSLVAARSPKTWTFEGSNDGASWTTLDAQTNVTGWVAGTARAFEVYSNETSYAYYRLNVTANNGDPHLSIGQWEMAGWTQEGAATSKVTLADLSADVLAALFPLGGIIEWDEFTQGAVPANFHLCDGSTVGGRTLPDLRDKFVVGAGSAYDCGDTGGEALHTLIAAEMPVHLHTIGHDHGSVTSGAESADHTHSGTTGTESADQAHSGTTGGRSAAHTHDQGSHRHTATVDIVRAQAAGTTGYSRYGTGASRHISTSEYVADFASPGATGTESADHSHSFTTGGRSAAHSHSITTGGRSAGHTHAVDLPNYSGNSGSAGSGSAHENRPPYYALAFVMRVS